MKKSDKFSNKGNECKATNCSRQILFMISTEAACVQKQS